MDTHIPRTGIHDKTSTVATVKRDFLKITYNIPRIGYQWWWRFALRLLCCCCCFCLTVNWARKEFLFKWIVRLIGMADPPADPEDSQELYEDPEEDSPYPCLHNVGEEITIKGKARSRRAEHGSGSAVQLLLLFDPPPSLWPISRSRCSYHQGLCPGKKTTVHLQSLQGNRRWLLELRGVLFVCHSDMS